METAATWFHGVSDVARSPLAPLVRWSRKQAQRASWGTARIYLRLAAVALVVAGLCVSSVILYAMLYRSFVPEVMRQRPIHLDYSSENSVSARVSLLNRQWEFGKLTSQHYPDEEQFLNAGQQYHIFLDVTVPQSPQNEQLSIVQSSVTIQTCDQKLLARSSRPIFVPHQNQLVRFARRLLKSPLHLTGWSKETQDLTVPVVEEFIEDKNEPACFVDVAFSSGKFEVYHATLRFEVELQGLRYLAYQHYIITAVLGIVTLFFVQLCGVLALYVVVRVSADQQNDNQKQQDSQKQQKHVVSNPSTNAVKQQQQQQQQQARGRNRNVVIPPPSPSPSPAPSHQSQQPPPPSGVSDQDELNVESVLQRADERQQQRSVPLLSDELGLDDGSGDEKEPIERNMPDQDTEPDSRTQGLRQRLRQEIEDRGRHLQS